MSGVQASPARLRFLEYSWRWSDIRDVAAAAAAAAEGPVHIYVERRGDRYRWSLAHPGGSYPLIRVTARFLEVDYHRIMVPFRTTADGFAIWCKDPDHPEEPDAWAVLRIEDRPSVDELVTRIMVALGGLSSGEAPEGEGRA